MGGPKREDRSPGSDRYPLTGRTALYFRSPAKFPQRPRGGARRAQMEGLYAGYKAWEGCGEQWKKQLLSCQLSQSRKTPGASRFRIPSSSLKRLGMKRGGGPAPLAVADVFLSYSVPLYSKCDSALRGLAAARQTRYCRPAAMCRPPSGANLLRVSETRI